MSKYIILFNCKNSENDKKWLYDIFVTHGANVKVIEPKVTIHKMLFKQGIKGKYLWITAQWDQAWKALKDSREEDIIICWYGGYWLNLFNILTGNRKRLILMNWLTPRPTKFYWKYLQKIAVNNSKCKIIVNSEKSKEKWEEFLDIENIKNFKFIPDIYDTSIPFKAPIVKRNKYIFTGGFTNRDWKMLMEIAEELGDYKFICVGLKNVFYKEVNQVPSNVEVYFELEAEKYYELMSGASVIALPLKDDNVSGLINITHAAQFGIPCCCTDYDFTRMYYPTECKKNLLSRNDKKEWVQRIKELLYMNEKEYISEVKYFQKFVQLHFAPEKAYEILNSCWKGESKNE